MREAYRYGISACCAVVLGLFAAVPESSWTSLPTLCLIRNAFGFECFGCGMTRALAAAMHGHLETALSFNQGVVVTAGILVVGLLQCVRR